MILATLCYVKREGKTLMLHRIKRDRDVHHHKIVDSSNGVSGEGFGWSYQQARTKAWDELKARGR